MRQNEPDNYDTDDIIIGSAQLMRVIDKHGMGWAALGGKVIYNRNDALNYAKKLDKLIQSNTPEHKPRRF